MASSSKETVAVDVMGGDRGPGVAVEGALAAAMAGIRVALVGDREIVEAELSRLGIVGLPRHLLADRIDLHHADDVITMEDSPASAVRRKSGASMAVAARLLAEGQVDAMVSPGNSGAMVACGLLIVRRLAGVDRPGIVTTLPTPDGEVVLLDTGANVECRPIHLAQYAVLGACYAERMLKRNNPRVGLLSNGAERKKGTALTRSSDAVLRDNPCDFDYCGYVEGRGLFAGDVDVAVADGFTGNVVLKVSEGAIAAISGLARRQLAASRWATLIAWGLRPLLQGIRKRVDYAEWGGAPLIGVRRTMMICHGASNAKAIRNAILNGARQSRRDLTSAMTKAIEKHDSLFAAARRCDAPGQSGQNDPGNDTTEQGQNSRHRTGSAVEGADQRRPGEDGRHQRRVDHRAFGDQRAPHP